VQVLWVSGPGGASRNQILSDSQAAGNFFESLIDHTVTVIDRSGAIENLSEV
jgi:hypothetical protein